MTEQTINGIDVGELQRTVQSIEHIPELAQFRFRTVNRWVEGTHSRAVINEFYEAGHRDESRRTSLVFEEDEPPVLFGHNLGANPVEFILVGLSGCLTTALVANAAARGVTLKSIESELEGDLDVRGFLGMDPTIRNGYSGIRVNFKIESDAPQEAIRELLDIARQRSPVYDIVTNSVPVSIGFQMR